MNAGRAAVLVLVDQAPPRWCHLVIAALHEVAEVRVAVPDGTPRPRSLSPAVALFARLDRWQRRRETLPAGLPEPADWDAVVDLTEQRASMRLFPRAQVLVVHPARLDERALLDALVAGRRTLTIEIRLTGLAGGERLAAESTVALARLSPRRSADRVGHRTAALVVRALTRLDAGAGLAVAGGPGLGEVPASMLRVARLLAAAAAAAVRNRLLRIDWRVSHGEAVSEEAFALPASLRTVAAPSGHFYADPFLAVDEQGTFLFVEDFEHARGRATIAVVDLASGGATTVLSAGHHLSYPLVFKVDGTWYMTPEAAESGEVVLHRCVDFPHQWVPDTVLLQGTAAYDPTLLHHDGLWWLFVAAGTPGAAIDDELHLWFADSLRGPYRPHPQNPVASTAVGARPAGRVAALEGRLLRPGQDASAEYGGGIVVHEIERLTTMEYRERVVERLDGAALGARGIHTYDRDGRWVAVDTKHRVSRLGGGAR